MGLANIITTKFSIKDLPVIKNRPENTTSKIHACEKHQSGLIVDDLCKQEAYAPCNLKEKWYDEF